MAKKYILKHAFNKLMSEARIKEILGVECENIQNTIQGRLDDNLDTTNKNIFDLISLTCPESDKIIEKIKKLIGKDSSNQMLVHLLLPKKRIIPYFQIQ